MDTTVDTLWNLIDRTGAGNILRKERPPEGERYIIHYTLYSYTLELCYMLHGLFGGVCVYTSILLASLFLTLTLIVNLDFSISAS